MKRLSIIIAIALIIPLFTFNAVSATFPSQIHISLMGANSVSIIWTTGDETQTSTVEYGLTSAYGNSATGRQFSYTWSPVIHEVILTSLSPDTLYHYRVGTPNSWSPDLSFRTPPLNPKPFSFAAVADMGTSSAAQYTIDSIIQENVDFVIHAGDLSYANGWQSTWDTWFTMLSTLASRVPYMPAIGNHENEPVYGYTAYYQRFALPNNEKWYSFNWSNAHFISIDTESPFSPGSEQYIWIDNDLKLASLNDSIYWKIVFFHRPPYSSSTTHGSSMSVRDALVPLFDKYKVDLVITGHDHDYERTYPLYNSTIADYSFNRYTHPNGTVYIVTGGAGASLYKNGTSEWTAFSISIYQYVKVSIYSNNTLHLEAKTSSDMTVFDEIWIKKKSMYDISLKQGWNLVSLPYAPSETEIDAILSDIKSVYSGIQFYINGKWESYYPNRNISNSDISIKNTMGFWIYMNKAGRLRVWGFESPAYTKVGKGWNLVGYPNITSAYVQDVFGNLFDKIDKIYTYTNSSFSELKYLSKMHPGYGYWLSTNANFTWYALF